MKIEKINDNQIRCTLSKSDLAERHLHISELAYGSEKAKELFREMMQQASDQVGFDAENIPLMIEAIPVSPDCLILVVTKVEDPEELDTRFSNFTPSGDEDEDSPENDTEPNSTPMTADQILKHFKQLKDMLLEELPFPEDSEHSDTDKNNGHSKAKKKNHSDKELADELDKKMSHVSCSFQFKKLDEVIAFSRVIAPFYRGENTLYKSTKESTYHLVMNISKHKAQDFNKICNIASDYGTQEHYNDITAAYFEEHYECISRNNAIQVLKKL